MREVAFLGSFRQIGTLVLSKDLEISRSDDLGLQFVTISGTNLHDLGDQFCAILPVPAPGDIRIARRRDDRATPVASVNDLIRREVTMRL